MNNTKSIKNKKLSLALVSSMVMAILFILSSGIAEAAFAGPDGGGNTGVQGGTILRRRSPPPPVTVVNEPVVELSSDDSIPNPCTNNKFTDYNDKVAQWLTCEDIAHGYNDNNKVYTKNDLMNRQHFHKMLARATKEVTTPHELGSDVYQYYRDLKAKGYSVSDKNDNISGKEASALIKEVSGKVVELTLKLTRAEAAGALFNLFAPASYK